MIFFLFALILLSLYSGPSEAVWHGSSCCTKNLQEERERERKRGEEGKKRGEEMRKEEDRETEREREGH